MRMVEPTFFKAMNFQNSASVVRRRVRLSRRRDPSLRRPKVPVVS